MNRPAPRSVTSGREWLRPATTTPAPRRTCPSGEPRGVLTAVPHDPTGGEPERVRIVPVSVQFQHLGDDAFHGVLLGRYAGEVTQVLLALLDRVGGIRSADALVAGHDAARLQGG